MVTTFWHFKVSCPTIRDWIMVYCLIIAGFSFRNMLDSTKLLKTEVAWLTQAGCQQGKLGVKLFHPGYHQACCRWLTLWQWRNPSWCGLGHGYAGKGLYHQHQAAARLYWGTEHSWSQNFKAISSQKKYHSFLIFFSVF